jgi:hypothetical protein
VKKFGNALFALGSVIEMNLHQDRVLAITLAAANQDFVLGHGLPLSPWWGIAMIGAESRMTKTALRPFINRARRTRLAAPWKTRLLASFDG